MVQIAGYRLGMLTTVLNIRVNTYAVSEELPRPVCLEGGSRRWYWFQQLRSYSVNVGETDVRY